MKGKELINRHKLQISVGQKVEILNNKSTEKSNYENSKDQIVKGLKHQRFTTSEFKVINLRKL